MIRLARNTHKKTITNWSREKATTKTQTGNAQMKFVERFGNAYAEKVHMRNFNFFVFFGKQ